MKRLGYGDSNKASFHYAVIADKAQTGKRITNKETTKVVHDEYSDLFSALSSSLLNSSWVQTLERIIPL